MWSLRHRRVGARAAEDSVALIGCFVAAGIAAGLVAGFAPLRSYPAPDEPRAARTGARSAAAQHPDPPHAGAATAPPARAGSVPGGAFEPVLHARKAGIRTCMGSVVAQSGRVIDARHAALSVWNTRDPDRGLFQSILALKYDNGNAPNGAAILTAAPDGASRCGGAFVQVYPTALSCGAIQASLTQSGKTVAALLDLPVIATADGTRELLMPSAGGGCVIVATNLN